MDDGLSGNAYRVTSLSSIVLMFEIDKTTLCLNQRKELSVTNELTDHKH